jgi:hypothetical protein
MLREILLLLASYVTCIASQHARDWELANVALHRGSKLNDAELGLTNLKMALQDASLLSETANYLRQPEGQARLVKMLADPEFRDQAKDVADQLKVDGVLPNIFRLDYYSSLTGAKDVQALISQAREVETAFQTPSISKANRAGRRLSDVQMAKAKPKAKPKAKAKKAKPKVASRATSSRPANVDLGFQDRSQAGTLAALKLDAEELNPIIKYWDPLTLGASGTDESFLPGFWGTSNAATIGFLRHAEIKHGRVAMAGFIGFCVHENGIHFPWAPFEGYEGLSAAGVWDALPVPARAQVIAAVGFLEIFSETQYVLEEDGTSHYMRGGKPGYFPTFKTIPHPVPFNLYDPFNLFGGLSEAEKAKKLKVEVNNGRLAMIGLISLLAASKSEDAVPILNGLVKRYDGNVMAPFEPGVSFG